MFPTGMHLTVIAGEAQILLISNLFKSIHIFK